MRRRYASGCGGIVDLGAICQSWLPSRQLASTKATASLQCHRPVRKSHTATPAERVRLVVALSETGGTLRYIAVSLEAPCWRHRWVRGVLILAGD